MHFFHSRRERPVGPVEASLHPTQKQRLYGNAGYSYSNAFQPAQVSTVTLPMTPPPDYQQLDPGLLQPQPFMAGYPQRYQSQQNLPLARPNAPYGQPPVWASTSTINVARPQTAGGWGQEQGWQQNANMVARPASNGQAACPIVRGMNQSAALCDRMAARLTDVLSRGDGQASDQDELEGPGRGLDLGPDDRPPSSRQAEEAAESRNGFINFKKTWLYQNSRLPPGMVPFNAYLPTWRIVCRAAQTSMDAYTRPPKGQREYYTDADPNSGTKAMIVKSQPVDDRKLVIVAIRGSQWNLIDWAVNFRPAPTEPIGFLDDEGNACHAGFLQVARAMITPVANQLRRLIEEDPSWVTSSLLFTGHSAGGAVASLLYAHMLATKVESDLTNIAGIFKRIHCVTFGTPPLSLLPLQTPSGRKYERDMFLSFVNEGDLVARADKPYVRSLLQLYAAPAPSIVNRPRLREKVSRQKMRADDVSIPTSRLVQPWPVPDATLSNAGRMVLLREKPSDRKHVEATQVTDGQLRNVMFGDPAMHPMLLYKKRIDELAFAAVSGRDAG